ncbi:MAG TPA: tetratricopeptide repeat protein [Saprospiraceae bacterium]|nr:tetratricopeptide repeat protein [Saprospiraceae bacterium]HPI06008.1 tetratricopeptide repeat protein [Saprospiraceae bacterium]
MAKRKVAQTEETIVVQEVQQVSAPFWERYQKQLLYALGALVVVVAGWWLYKTLIVAPKQQEAVASMWQAQNMFERDSFRLALDGPGGGFDGFVALADKYSGTPAGNSANYYAGISYLQLGEFDNAIQYLEKYDAEGSLLPAMKYGALGDAYSEKKDFGKAMDLYEKATDATDNELLSAIYLKRLGLLYEHEGKKEEAVKAFERLRRDYPNQQSQDWREVEKYIYRAGGVK